MKLQLTRSTPAGVLTVEAEYQPGSVIDAVRRLEAEISTAEADVRSRHGAPGPVPTIEPEAPANHAPVIATDGAPRTGKDLWSWAESRKLWPHVLATGRVLGLPARDRYSVFRWGAADVQAVYHELLVKPVRLPGAPRPVAATRRSRP